MHPPLHLHVNGAATGVAVHRAHTWAQRARGLLGRAPLDHRSALWLRPCAAVHTWGMGYPLDLVFLGADGKVLRIVHRLRPFSGAACFRSDSVLELQAGVAAQRRWQVGDHMHLDVADPPHGQASVFPDDNP